MLNNGIILVPTDFSDHCAEALKQAVSLASMYNCEVHLLHVITSYSSFDAELITTFQIDEMQKLQRESAIKRLADQARSVDMVITTHTTDGLGDPANAICDVAKELSANLIITGRHSRQGTLEHMLIGSTAERIVRFSPCSVLIAMP
ncbi:universal stress protein [Mariprofundus sp. EBB-1]|uniref:universal stress protein n=1 Tax=Mariprofundus sp. EBB-1 TaxID=2650971 RepID=UPI000EF19573|nr:universal stress protein [Mariprofundus sp. EBB-1]RLL50503.1 universal stress protein [Mariprofundus sp. EBB-1]